MPVKREPEGIEWHVKAAAKRSVEESLGILWKLSVKCQIIGNVNYF